MPGSESWGRQQHTQKNSVELEASLAPAEAEVGAVAKADQKYKNFIGVSLDTTYF